METRSFPKNGEHYTLLLFDADGTLLDFQTAERTAFLAAMTACGVSSSKAEEIYPCYRDLNDALWLENEKGILTKEALKKERWRLLSASCGISAQITDKAAPLYSRFLSEQGALLPGAELLLRTLQKRGRRLFLITNGLSASQYGRIRAAGIEDCFEGIFVSEELGFSKPDPRFMTAAAAQIPHFQRERALIIGDRLTSDVALAAAVHLPCLWLTDKEREIPAGMPVLRQMHTLWEVGEFLLPDDFKKGNVLRYETDRTSH